MLGRVNKRVKITARVAHIHVSCSSEFSILLVLERRMVMDNIDGVSVPVPRIFWNLPGGALDPIRESTALQTILREYSEETGLRLNPARLDEMFSFVFSIRLRNGVRHHHFFLYVTDGEHPRPVIIRPDEIIAVRWFPLSALPDGTSKCEWAMIHPPSRKRLHYLLSSGYCRELLLHRGISDETIEATRLL